MLIGFTTPIGSLKRFEGTGQISLESLLKLCERLGWLNDADSLPDGWGSLLLDRSLIAKGIALENITPLDRLSYVGKGGMEALVYKPEAMSSKPNGCFIDLDGLDRAAQQIIMGTASDIMDQWLHLAGSSGGGTAQNPDGIPPGFGTFDARRKYFARRL